MITSSFRKDAKGGRGGILLYFDASLKKIKKKIFFGTSLAV